MGSKNKTKNKLKSEKPDGAATSEASRSNGSGGGGGGFQGGKIISDPRFASVHSDPRFREAPRQKTKVAIDSRFNRMFTNKNFTSSKAHIDKRGKQKKEASQDKLKHYYRIEEEEDNEKEKELDKEDELKKNDENEEEEESESEKDSSESEESDSELKKPKKKALKVKNESKSESEEEEEDEEEESGEEDEESESELKKPKKKTLKMKSESESEEEEVEEESGEEDDDSGDSTSTTDSDEEDEAILDDGEDTFMQPEENVPEIDKETHRLAIVNMDWTQVQAVDLYVLLSSFLSKEGQIKSVTIYPSEFGLKQMAEEAVRGPVGLFDDDEDENDNSDEEIDENKLRAYELSRLKYYFAVVECDSIATADHLYKTCDGVEFERSAVKLDLRFIPDTMEFKHKPRDVATEAPPNYEGLDFQNRALQQSKVNISWDDDEPHRVTAMKRHFDDDQLADIELKEYLAVSESESDEENKKNMYRKLLESGEGLDENNDEDEDDEEDEGLDMEVTFNTGLEDISKRILEKKDKKSESVWDAYLKKRDEKRKAKKKNKSKYSSDDEISDDDVEFNEQPDDFFMDESIKKKDRKEKKKKKVEEAEDEKAKAELELLFVDEETNVKGYNLKNKDKKGKKGKKGKEVVEEGKLPSVDYEDSRFSGLFTSPDYALDPTDPQFKRSVPYERQLAQKQKKSDAENISGKEIEEVSREEESDLPLKKEKYELSSLVRSIKMKSKQNPGPTGLPPLAKKRKHNK